MRPGFLVFALSAGLAGTVCAGDPGTKTTSTASAIEPKAVELLKSMSRRLAGAASLSFTAIATEESPSIYGAPLAYTTTSEVLVKRPDKLRVVTTADGPASEFTYDGKRMVSFHPAENLAAVADAPPSLDAMLSALYKNAGTYFPFTDLIVADPYGDLAKGLKLAFSIGQSKVVGGTTTDMVAYETEGVFIQIWIGSQDMLPRRMRAVFHDDPLRLRHELELTDWKLDPAIAPDAFSAGNSARAARIRFAHPNSASGPKAAAKANPK